MSQQKNVILATTRMLLCLIVKYIIVIIKKDVSEYQPGQGHKQRDRAHVLGAQVA